MKEYIERDVLLEEDFTDMFLNLYDEAVFAQIVKLAPTADVAPVIHGEWIEYIVGLSEELECSVCKKNNLFGVKTPYCPNCGAKMDGDK